MIWTNKGKQFDIIGNEFLKRHNILIWGAGDTGKFCFERIKWLGNIDGFIDGSTEKQISGYCGLTVISPTEILQRKNRDFVIIVGVSVKSYVQEITRILRRSGYIQGLDFFYFEDFIIDDFLLHIYAVYVRNMIYLQSGCYVPSTICSLNCIGCLNFTKELNETKSHVVHTLEEAKTDVDIFFKWVDYTA